MAVQYPSSGSGGPESDPVATASIAAHVAAADPHTQYQKESEKGAVSGYASLDTGGKVPSGELDLSSKANASHTHAESDITGLVADLAAKAPLASPTLTGDPKAPTPAPGDNDVSIATTAFVTAAIAAGGGGGESSTSANIVLASGWSAWSFDPFAIKDGNAIVTLQGQAFKASVTFTRNAVITGLTMPAGYNPGGSGIFPLAYAVNSDWTGVALIGVNYDGTFSWLGADLTASNFTLSFDGATFHYAA